VASRLRNKGSVVKCPHHNGHCTANLAEDAVIGNETEYRRQCTTVLNDTLKIANITTDGDSKSFNGVNNAQGKGATQLRDIRHLSNSMKRAVQNGTFSLSMYGWDISPQYLYFAALMPHCRVYYLGIQKLFFYF
jgi:hypothetical protein